MRKFSLPPVIGGNTEVLILGTLPSDTSLSVEQYYSDPRNDFWKLLEAALEKSIDGMSYDDKLELLKANRIGLWDAFHTCFRPGSMDVDIAESELNDFTLLKVLAPKLRLVCFNGARSAAAEDSLVQLGYQTRLLPSSSGANRRDQDRRLAYWKIALQ